MTVHENRHGISSVTAAVGSHCDAIVIFVGSDFDLRVAFDVHGSARLFRQAPPLVGTRSARDNRGKYILLATATNGGTTAERHPREMRNGVGLPFLHDVGCHRGGLPDGGRQRPLQGLWWASPDGKEAVGPSACSRHDQAAAAAMRIPAVCRRLGELRNSTRVVTFSGALTGAGDRPSAPTCLISPGVAP